MESKQCAICLEVKSVSDFYMHHASGKHERYCKACKREIQRKYKKYPVNKSGVPHEQDIINLLCSIGIYACSGKRSQFRWTDIVAWGCVQIEAKLGLEQRSNTFLFRFTPKQRKEGISGDVVVLMIDNAEQTRYFVLPSNSPVFYKADGSIKVGFSLATESTDIRAKRNQDLILPYEDDWQLIERIRQEKSARQFRLTS